MPDFQKLKNKIAHDFDSEQFYHSKIKQQRKRLSYLFFKNKNSLYHVLPPVYFNHKVKNMSKYFDINYSIFLLVFLVSNVRNIKMNTENLFK